MSVPDPETTPDARALVQHADSLNDRGAYDDGLRAAEEAIAASVTDGAAWTAKGWALENLGRLPEAEDAYRAALRHEPELPWAEVGLATVLEKTDRRTEAQAIYRSVADRPLRDERRAEVLEIVGWSCLKAGRIDEALRLFGGALEIEPNRTAVRFDLALALLAAGEGESALAEYRTGLRDSEDPDALRAHVSVALEDLFEASPAVDATTKSAAEDLLSGFLHALPGDW